MPEQYAVTRLLNYLFGGIVTSIMQAIGIHPANPGAPITNTFTVELLVVLGLIAFFVVVRLTLSPDKPGPAQHIAESTDYLGQVISAFAGGTSAIALPKVTAPESAKFLKALDSEP